MGIPGLLKALVGVEEEIKLKERFRGKVVGVDAMVW